MATTTTTLQGKLGSAADVVRVEASATQVNTSNATLGNVVERATITTLPLNGRNFVQLAQLIPGANPGTPASITVRRGRGTVGQTDSGFGSTSVGVNGQREQV